MLPTATARDKHARLICAANLGGLHTETLGMNRGDNAQASTGVANAVLLVEPDQATRQLYAREVGRFWHVYQAATIEAGQALLRSETILAVVFEPFLTVLAGSVDQTSDATIATAWEFLREGAASGVPFIICSVVDERRTAYSAGAALYLLKPLSPQQLVVELQRLLGAASMPLNKEQLG